MVSITCFSAHYIGHLVLFLLFLLVFGTHFFFKHLYPFACFCFGSLLYSVVFFGFVSDSRPGFVIFVLAFPVLHIRLVFGSFFIRISLFVCFFSKRC